MTRIAAACLALAIGALATAALSACGGSDAKLLPGRTAEEIEGNLDSVQRLVDEHDCIGARDAALQVSEQVDGVEGVDPKLKRALEGGAARLNEVVVTCEEENEETVEETVPTTTAPPEKPK